MSNFIPLEQLQQQPNESMLSVDLRLPPHINPELLEINSGRIEAVARWAGFSSVHINEYQGETTQYSAPGIGGMFGDGTAGAVGAGSATHAERSKATLQEEDDLAPTCSLSSAEISINATEVRSRIVDREKKGQETYRAWASELNTAVQRGLRLAARKNLLYQLDSTLIISLMPLVQLGIAVMSPPSPALAPAVAAGACLTYGVGVISDIMENKRKAGEYHLREKRWSILSCGPIQPDRFAMAALHTTLPIIRKKRD